MANNDNNREVNLNHHQKGLFGGLFGFGREVIKKLTTEIFIILAAIIIVIAICGLLITDFTRLSITIGGVVIIALLGVYITVHKSRPVQGPPPPIGQPGQYFIGIDLGRNKIDYCLMDYNKFVEGEYSKVREGEKPTPRGFSDIYEELVNIVQTLSQEARTEDIHSIEGIGLGLPGQVNPRKGLFVKCPGIDFVDKEPLVEELSGRIKQKLRRSSKYREILSKRFRIEIDNDVRCATRYVWKKYSFEDVICIFPGIGLGSGIVLGGKMLYGYNFTAGEIGHTTISESCELLGVKRCKCNMEGYHWEMFASRDGMLNIAKNLNSEEYERLKANHETIIQQERYQKLLEEEEFKEHLKKHSDDEGELTTYFLSLAFYAGEGYVCKVVREFIKYLAIGVANYINVINPERVYLGGGIIRGFYDDERVSPCLADTTAVLLRNEIKKYALPSASEVAIVKRDYRETKIASMGAALIFKDQSYFEYKKRGI